MTIIYRKKRNPHIVAAGKAAARGELLTCDCPKCGNEAKVVEKHKDRATYKCVGCNELSTFTIAPDDVVKVPRTKKSTPGILIRDRSKEKNTTVDENVETEEITDNIETNLNTIREGMEKRSNLLFEYAGKDGNKTLRDVEPYKLMRNKKGELMLYAYCIAGNGIRTFKLSSIKSMSVSETEFKPRWIIEDNIKK